ncbi:hypothetical protein [Mycoplasma sp. CSL7503-lung]|uniref:hypothetical protein n=1 Tax=Mycoplasma sp. CSL7503-lung TaxID=536372 RepID=UPI0021CF683E|nr:hypothetical protein [Mycoplasma sp. CSL7503-lung]MCU4706776.1 hypothetical protein [Mycoplasma sp. CSL7503-lung]
MLLVDNKIDEIKDLNNKKHFKNDLKSTIISDFATIYKRADKLNEDIDIFLKKQNSKIEKQIKTNQVIIDSLVDLLKDKFNKKQEKISNDFNKLKDLESELKKYKKVFDESKKIKDFNIKSVIVQKIV